MIIPKNYKPRLDVRTTEAAIPRIKSVFEGKLSENLNLARVSAPLFVKTGTGLNDDLNGVERAVTFEIPSAISEAVIVHSLAKWKRFALAKYGFPVGSGIWTDMNAIRRDEELSNIHSAYVDQWDWEKVITKEQRTAGFLVSTVSSIYEAIRDTERFIFQVYGIEPTLKPQISVVTTVELERKYPNLSRKERENAEAKEKGAIFILGIGYPLSDGSPHDGRAPDYDDWITENSMGCRGLNGDIVVWNQVLESAFELSSMGIRVDKDSLVEQLGLQGKSERLNMEFHRMLVNDELPLSIGGGIGQSRLCMLLLKKVHIGEVQASIWPDEMLRTLEQSGISLL